MLRERGQGVVALYPSPAGATESELHLAAWDELRRREPGARRARARGRGADREPAERSARATPIVPIDRCYELVGMIKSRWEGISGGSAIDDAVAEFFASLDEAARA